MRKRVLITGGGGFIGSHLADELLRHGYQVRALDNLLPQVHGPDAVRPTYLHRDVELIVGDIRDPEAVRNALQGVDVCVPFCGACRRRAKHVRNRRVHRCQQSGYGGSSGSPRQLACRAPDR